MIYCGCCSARAPAVVSTRTIAAAKSVSIGSVLGRREGEWEQLRAPVLAGAGGDDRSELASWDRSNAAFAWRRLLVLPPPMSPLAAAVNCVRAGPGA